MLGVLLRVLNIISKVVPLFYKRNELSSAHTNSFQEKKRGHSQYLHCSSDSIINLILRKDRVV